MKLDKYYKFNTKINFLYTFLTLAVINGIHMILTTYLQKLTSNYSPILYIVLTLYFLLVTFLLSIYSSFIKYVTYYNPMLLISKAANKIANGDFSARLAPLHKKSEDYIDKLFDDFNKMAQELSNIETLKTDFVSNVSHELKTPLSVIQNYAMAIQQEDLPEIERKNYAKTIVDATEKLSQLITNILKISKLENQDIVPIASPYNLSEQLRICALSFENIWEEKNINFEAYINDDIIIKYDESMLDLIWNNLLANALKFTPIGGTIKLSLSVENNHAIITVSDNGCGMNENTKKYIFDKFYQGDTSHSQEGNGLGLSLVMTIIELIQGEIIVNSKLDEGSSFTVKLKI